MHDTPHFAPLTLARFGGPTDATRACSARLLDIQVFDVEGVLLDKFPSGLNLVAHQNAEHPVGLDGIFDNLTDILTTADRIGIGTHTAAERVADERIATARQGETA